MARARKTYKVNSPTGLNVRQHPTKNAQIMRVLPAGHQVAVDTSREAPDGWTPIVGDGYVMSEFLK